jgi:glutathione synthase
MTIPHSTLAFVMDPLGSLDVAADTTYVLIVEALRRGHRVLYLDPADLGVTDGRPIARARPVTEMRPEPGDPAELGPEQSVALDDEADVVLQRQDPPVDAEYMTTTQILGLCRQALVLNRPAGILAANEKLYACAFPELMAETLVSRRMEQLIAFMTKLGGEMIVKPLDGKGGEGIFHLHHGDRNLFSILEQSTAFETRRVMAQRYLPEVREGDKRILLLEGEAIGAVLRVPREQETRSNLHVGGRPRRASLDEHDRRIIDALAPSLRRDGLFFVGIDVIGGRLTEVNVTSPTGVREINALEGTRLEARILDGVERLLDEKRIAGRNFPS